MNTAAFVGTSPADARESRIPCDAEELWIIAVTPAPTRIPRKGAHRNKGCLKYLGFSQGINRIRHGIHTDKKDTKPNDDTGYILALLPFPHQRYDYADHNCDWCQCRGAEHFCPFTCGNQPTRDGCTDIRTHDNADCLCQIHQPCVYKADNHNRCGRGALDNRRNQCTQRNAHQLILRQHFKNLLHFGAGSVL